jgi:hypothetical protein
MGCVVIGLSPRLRQVTLPPKPGVPGVARNGGGAERSMGRTEFVYRTKSELCLIHRELLRWLSREGWVSNTRFKRFANATSPKTDFSQAVLT